MDSSDRRKGRVLLTPLGRGTCQRLLMRSRELIRDVLTSLPENMRMEFSRWVQWYSVENSLDN